MPTPDTDRPSRLGTRHESEAAPPGRAGTPDRAEAGVGDDRLDRWEHGSHFELSMEQGVARFPWDELPHCYWGSGRYALRGLLEWGRETQGWQRLMVPSYYCQHTLAGVKGAVALTTYPWSPTDRSFTSIRGELGDVILSVSTFGLAPRLEIDQSAVVIEDHTHDPISPHAAASRAQYAFASLRKTYPLPDGGVVWSPQRLALPDQLEMTPDHGEAVLERLSAMALKRHYLDGADVVRSAYRELYVSSEKAIGSGAASGISTYSRLRLPTLPVSRWRDQRGQNIDVLRSALEQSGRIRVLQVPFAAVLLFDEHAVREQVRRALIYERVFPAVLWPLEKTVVEGIPDEHVELSRRLLAVHADQRYTAADMLRVSRVLGAAVPS